MRTFRIRLTNTSGNNGQYTIYKNNINTIAQLSSGGLATNLTNQQLLSGVLVNVGNFDTQLIIKNSLCNDVVNYSIPNVVIPTPTPAMRIEVGAIFGGVSIAVEGGLSPWTAQFSLNNGASWTSAITVNALSPINPAFEFTLGTGQINFSVNNGGVYLFRVISGGDLISNTFTKTINLSQTTPTATPTLTRTPTPTPTNTTTVSSNFVFEEVTIDYNFPENYNVFSMSATNMRFTVPMPYNIPQYLKGFDATVTGGYVSEPGNFNPFTSWKQFFYFNQSTENNVIVKGNQTYYFRPHNYETNLNTNAFDFYQTFPDFTLPDNKLIVLEGGVGTRDTYGTQFNTTSGFSELRFDLNAHQAMTNKGVSHVKGLEAISPENTMKFQGDAWLADVGYPTDGINPLPDHEQRVIQWTQNYTPQQVFNYWKTVHYDDPNSGNYVGNITYYLWNFELPWLWPIIAPTHFKQFMEIWNTFLEVNLPNLKIAVWRKSAFNLNNFSENYNFYNDFNTIYNSNFTPNQLKNYIDAGPIGMNNGYSFTEGLFNTKTVQQVGFYQTYFSGKENPAQIIFEYIINKKASPLALVLLIFWSDIEPVIGSDFGNMYETFTVDGNSRSFGIKPRVDFSTMQTYGAWATAFLDGADIWEIVPWNGDKREWKYTDPFYPSQNVLPNVYPYTPVKNIDWFMSGVWGVSVNKDIIDANTKWNFVNNNSWQLFSNSEFQDPLIGYKLSADGQQALVLVTDFTNRFFEPKVHNVVINGTTYPIDVYSRYTSICRINL